MASLCWPFHSFRMATQDWQYFWKSQHKPARWNQPFLTDYGTSLEIFDEPENLNSPDVRPTDKVCASPLPWETFFDGTTARVLTVALAALICILCCICLWTLLSTRL